MTTQNAQIRAALMAGDVLSPLEALDRFGTFRLAARVAELRQDGDPIETAIIRDGRKCHASYYWRIPA